MQKPYLYILCGVPFAGKTTIATALTRQSGIQRVAIDEINNERGIWDDEAGLSPEEWARTYAEAYRRIGLLLSQGHSVLDDSANFTRQLRDSLRAIAERFDAHTAVIYVDTPLAEARRRWQENRQTGLRGDVRDSDFALVIEQFEAPTADENVLRYDGSLPLDEWIRLTFAER